MLKGFQQPLVFPLAPQQNGAKPGWKCDHTKVARSLEIFSRTFFHFVILEIFKARSGQLAAREPHVTRHNVFNGLQKHSGNLEFPPTYHSKC